MAALFACLAFATTSHAGSHLWQINELFSNPDGTIQFVEMRECCGAVDEIGIGNKSVTSTGTGSSYTFPANLPAGTTANQYLLIATAGFAALPGAPTPDHILPDNFLDLNADTIQYHIYPNSVLSFTAGDLPTDGLNSWNRGNPNFSGVNSPTNYNGETGSVDVSPGVPDFKRCDANQDGSFDIADAVSILGTLFGGVATLCELALDCNDDNAANIADAVAGLDVLFGGGAPPLEPFMTCGQDPTGVSMLTCMSFTACP